MSNAHSAAPTASGMVTATIALTSIYRHSAAKVCFMSDASFVITITGEILAVALGKRGADLNQVQAVEDKGVYKIELTVLGWIKERRVDDSKPDSTENNYGMRFFPFVSSNISSVISLNEGKLRNVIVELPDAYRVIWYGSKVLAPDETESCLDHSYSPTLSSYIFSLETATGLPGRYQVDVKVRHSSNEIMKLVTYPLYYYVLSLLGISLAYDTHKASLVLAAIGATWTFMLKRWSNSNLPQQNTLLTHSYIIAGILSLIWGVNWLVGGYWTLLMSPSFLIFFGLVNYVTKKYAFEGLMPDFFATYWSRKVKESDQKQKIALMQQSATSGG